MDHGAAFGRDDADATRQRRAGRVCDSARRVLRLQLAIQSLALQLGQADAFGKQQIGDQLAAALAFVQVQAPCATIARPLAGVTGELKALPRNRTHRSWAVRLSFSEK